MKPWLAFLTVPVALHAQQSAPANASQAEAALRGRVEQFYQLQMEKKYRQAEAFVAEDTKDWFYNSAKSTLLGVTIEKVEIDSGGTKASVSIKAKSQMMMMGRGMMQFEMPAVTTWKLENGQWMWYIDPALVARSPFGQLKTAPVGTGPSGRSVLPGIVNNPNLSSLESQVQIDRTTIVLSAGAPDQTATISNSMPGFVDLTMHAEKIPGVAVELDNDRRIPAGGKAVIRFRRTAEGPAKGTVHFEVAPLGKVFDVQVETK